MRLSDYNNIFYTVLRDGEFTALGKLKDKPEGRSLSYLEDITYANQLQENQTISCIICTREIAEILMMKEETNIGIAIALDKPKATFLLFHNWLFANKPDYVTDIEASFVGSNCHISNTLIMSETGVIIGDNVTIEENVILRSGTIIGDNTVIRAGVIIGASNTNTGIDKNGKQLKFVSCGGVRIEKNCEIGYGTIIGKGIFPYQNTYIGQYTIIDSQVSIAHNCIIGKNVLVMAQTQICGNVILEDHVKISPKVIVSNGKHLYEYANVTLGSVVVNNVKANMKVSGNFAIEHSKFMSWHLKKNRK